MPPQARKKSPVSRALHCRRRRRVVGNNEVDAFSFQALSIDLSGCANRGWVARICIPWRRRRIPPRRKCEIVRAGFRRDTQSFLLRAANQRHGKLRRKMNDMNPRLEFARERESSFRSPVFPRQAAATAATSRTSSDQPSQAVSSPPRSGREVPRERAAEHPFRASIRQRGAEIVFADVFKFRHARRHEETLEPKYSRAVQCPQFTGIAGHNAAPESDVHPAFLCAPQRA